MPTLDTSIFSAASSTNTIAAAAVAAKNLAMATWPFWGLPLALILLTVFIGVVIWMISKAKVATPISAGKDGSPIRQKDIELEAAIRWNEAETKARRDFARQIEDGTKW
jgi:hypothetical protein